MPEWAHIAARNHLGLRPDGSRLARLVVGQGLEVAVIRKRICCGGNQPRFVSLVKPRGQACLKGLTRGRLQKLCKPRYGGIDTGGAERTRQEGHAQDLDRSEPFLERVLQVLAELVKVLNLEQTPSQAQEIVSPPYDPEGDRQKRVASP